MRFRCLEVTCGKPFGWTAKKIVSKVNEKGETVTYETVVCPYCGSLDFDELPFTKSHTPPPKQPNHTKSLAIPNMEPEADQFDPADLMQHRWKGKKIAQGKWEEGSLNLGWDFKDEFKPETLRALKAGVTLKIDQYEAKLNGNLVSIRKV